MADTSTEQVLREALNLPQEERRFLVESLIASLPDDDTLDESWREEIRRRSAEYDAGQVTTIPWDEVKRKARAKLGLK